MIKTQVALSEFRRRAFKNLVLFFLLSASLAYGQTSNSGETGSNSAAQATAPMPPMGIGITELFTWERTCSGCHKTGKPPQDDAGKIAPPLEALKQLHSERIYEALTVGSMQVAAEKLTGEQKIKLAQWIGTGSIGSGDFGDISKMTGQCADNPLMSDPEKESHWNGWGAGIDNSRSQSASHAGLTPAQVPKLKLLWSFGIPGGAEVYSQPSVVSGRVFFGSDNKYVYSLNAATGCSYWSFHADAGVRTAPTIAPIQGYPATQYAVYFGDVRANVYAVDARNGELLWKIPMAEIATSRITAAPTLYENILYVSFTTLEGLMAASPTYECCTGRGSVAALNAQTGELLWRTSVIQEELKSHGRNSAGTPIWGPAGAGVWNAPTIDPKRGLIYVGTGNAHTQPAAKGSDAIVAMDMKTGQIKWVYQDIKDDPWLARCKPGVRFGNCPTDLGPDWDFGTSPVLRVLPDGIEVLVGANKGGIVVAVDPDNAGAVVWRTNLAKTPPSPRGLILFGGAVDEDTGYYPLQTGGVAAVALVDGKRKWTTELGPANPDEPGRRGQAAAATVIPGVVFTGGWDGVLHALSTNGQQLWKFNTARDYQTVNGVKARGGSMGAPGATIVNGRLFVGSGFIGVAGGMPGNVLLAFSAD